MGPLRTQAYGEVEPWLRSILVSLRTSNEVMPYRILGVRYEAVERFSFCPEVTHEALGPELGIESSLGKLSRTYARSESGIVAQTTFEIPTANYLGAVAIENFNRFTSIAQAHAPLQFWIRRD